MLLYEVRRPCAHGHCYRTKHRQACEKQEKCRDAARALVYEVDDLLDLNYEELELELKRQKETRAIVVKITKLITWTSDYIIKNNKNIFISSFSFSMSASFLSAQIILMTYR